jgi:hypothetical protein
MSHLSVKDKNYICQQLWKDRMNTKMTGRKLGELYIICKMCGCHSVSICLCAKTRYFNSVTDEQLIFYLQKQSSQEQSNNETLDKDGNIMA